MSTTEPYFGEPLTEAEREILTLVCAGLTNPQIARLRLSSKSTIKHQIASVLVKLGARNRAHAVAIYIKEEEDGSS